MLCFALILVLLLLFGLVQVYLTYSLFNLVYMLKFNFNLGKMLKLESKDLLLVWVWHIERAYPIKPCMLGVGCL
jgi:hypothetical protein